MARVDKPIESGTTNRTAEEERSRKVQESARENNNRQDQIAGNTRLGDREEREAGMAINADDTAPLGAGLYEEDALFDEYDTERDDDDLIRMGTAADVSSLEKETLTAGNDYYPSRDEEHLADAAMDNTDFDGEPLNEKGFGTYTRTANNAGTSEEENEIDQRGDKEKGKR